MLARLTISYFFYVSKTIPSNREYRELNEVRENSIAKLPNFSNLTKKSQWLIALFNFANSYPCQGATILRASNGY